MTFDILGLVIEVAIQTVFLTAALWIMIKLQRLDYHFLALLGSAVLACVLEKILDIVLDPFLGIVLGSYISTPIVVIVLLVCIAKVTQADHVDVVFTVGVGYALLFAMNLWLMGTLMGDLRPSTRHAVEEPVAAEMEVEDQAAAKTNQPAVTVPAANKATEKNAAGGKSPGKNEPTSSTKPLPAVRPQDKSAPTATRPPGNPNGPVPAELVKETARGFSLKGIISSGKPSAMIYSGVKTYTVFPGDSLAMETVNGKITVRCEQLDKDKVVLNIAGEQVTLSLSGAAP